MKVITSTLVLSAAWFDWHWVLLLLPLGLGVASYYAGRRVQRHSAHWQRGVAAVFGASLMVCATTGYVLAVMNNASYSHNHFLPLIHLQNLDLVVAMLGGYGLVVGRYGIARTIAPLGFILAAAKIINNPGAHIASYEIATAILIGSVPLFGLAFRHRVSWRQALITSAVTLVFFVHLSIINQTAGTNFGTMAASELGRNPFYAFWQSSMLKIGAYIVAFVGLQLLAWGILSWLAYGHQHHDMRWRQFWSAMQTDEKHGQKQIANYGLFSWYVHHVTAGADLPLPQVRASQQALILLGNLGFGVTKSSLALWASKPIVTHFVRARQSVGNNAPNFFSKNL